MNRKNISIQESKIETLKNALGKSLGREVVSHSDCEFLANKILKKTERRIGTTTIRRFFGLDETTNLPSMYTLDTLCQFCGFESWIEFKNGNSNHKQNEFSQQDNKLNWDSIKSKSLAITEYTLKTVKAKSGINYDLAIHRKFAIEKINSFLDSDYTATAFIAQSGYGKTILLAKAIENIWFKQASIRKDDIVWFLDARMITGLISKGFDLNKWLTDLTGLSHNQNYRDYFYNNPNERKGDIIIIIDSIDDIIFRANKLHEFFTAISDLIISNSNIPWIKIILNFRNLTWNKFVDFNKNYIGFQNFWYGVAFDVYNESFINIPPLTELEIESVARNYKDSIDLATYENLLFCILSGDFTDLLSNPFYLQLFIQVIQDKKSILKSDVGLIIEFIKSKISDGYFGEEKISIISEYLKAIDYGKNSNHIFKKSLLSNCDIKDSSRAYQELLSSEVLIERHIFNKYGTFTTCLEFGYNNVLNFMIANKIIDENGLNIFTFDKIFNSYIGNESKIEIFCWMIKIAFYQKNYRVIFNLKKILRTYGYSSNNTNSKAWNELWQIIRVIGIIFRHDQEAREHLIPLFAADLEWQVWFFESFIDLDNLVLHHYKAIYNYLIYKRTDEAMIFGHSLLLFHDYLIGDFENAINHVEFLNKIPLNTNTLHPLLIGRSLTYRVLYYKHIDKQIAMDLIHQAMIIEADIHTQNPFVEHIPAFNGLIMLACNYLNLYNESIYLWDKFFQKYEHTYQNRLIPEFELAKLLVAEAYLETGKINHGLSALASYDGHFYKTTRNNYGFYLYSIKAKFMKALGQPEQAKRFLEKAHFITQKFQFSFLQSIIEKQLNE